MQAIFGNKYEQLFVYRIFEDSNKSICSTLEICGTQKRLSNEK